MADCWLPMSPFSSLYHSLPSVLAFLQTTQFCHVEQVQKLLDIFNSNYNKDVQPSSRHLHPFIVVEGLDGSGKSNLVKKLRCEIFATSLSTPPSCLLDLRNWFDEQPRDVRRAYYSLGNYIVSQQVDRMVQTSPVIMDRYWHSTASYAIADEVRDRNICLPPRGDPVYQWPEDLTKPDIVLFLNVGEFHRLQRLDWRSTTNTTEEQELAANTAWRNNVVEVHKRIYNIGMEVVDANESIDRVATMCINIIRPKLL